MLIMFDPVYWSIGFQYERKTVSAEELQAASSLCTTTTIFPHECQTVVMPLFIFETVTEICLFNT